MLFESHFKKRFTILGFFSLGFSFVFMLARTMSWSLNPGATGTFWPISGFVENRRSKVCFPHVGLCMCCIREKSFAMSIILLLMHSPYWGYVLRELFVHSMLGG